MSHGHQRPKKYDLIFTHLAHNIYIFINFFFFFSGPMDISLRFIFFRVTPFLLGIFFIFFIFFSSSLLLFIFKNNKITTNQQNNNNSFDEEYGAFMVGVINLCSAIGRVTSGHFGDKIGFLNALTCAMTTSTGYYHIYIYILLLLLLLLLLLFYCFFINIWLFVLIC